MPNCDFYAIDSDITKVLDGVFAHEGWRLHELSSQPDQPVRVFNSTAAVAAARPLGEQACYFQLYSPEMRGAVQHRQISLRPGAIPGASFRFSTEGWGLIQLNFGELRADGRVVNSHTNHNSEARARGWSDTFPELGSPSAWDWDAVTTISNRLNKLIRRLAVSKFGARPVLPDAQAALTVGRARFE